MNIISSSALGITACAALFASQSAFAQSDPYHITSSEKAACTADAVRLCASAYPDEGKLLSCMLENKASLSSSCSLAFNAGLKRRRIVSR